MVKDTLTKEDLKVEIDHTQGHSAIKPLIKGKRFANWGHALHYVLPRATPVQLAALGAAGFPMDVTNLPTLEELKAGAAPPSYYANWKSVPAPTPKAKAAKGKSPARGKEAAKAPVTLAEARPFLLTPLMYFPEDDTKIPTMDAVMYPNIWKTIFHATQPSGLGVRFVGDFVLVYTAVPLRQVNTRATEALGLQSKPAHGDVWIFQREPVKRAFQPGVFPPCWKKLLGALTFYVKAPKNFKIPVADDGRAKPMVVE